MREKTLAAQGKNGIPRTGFVPCFVPNRPFLSKLPESTGSKAKKAAARLLDRRARCGWSNSKKSSNIRKNFLQNGKRKTLNGAKLVKGFCGAPNRIRTCGLLIRSQTLYPAELWVRFPIFRSFLLGTKSIIPHGAKNVNTFLKNIFHFLPSAGNGRIWDKIPATYGEKWVAENEKEKIMFFPCKEKKKASKTANGASSGGMRRKTETSDVTARASVDNSNYPQFSPKNGDLLVDNCG